LALGPYAGKETGETALFRSLFDQLKTGDLVLSDRYYGGLFGDNYPSASCCLSEECYQR
jgi:hypothetical protein